VQRLYVTCENSVDCLEYGPNFFQVQVRVLCIVVSGINFL